MCLKKSWNPAWGNGSKNPSRTMSSHWPRRGMLLRPMTRCCAWDDTKPVAEFLLRHPEHRHTDPARSDDPHPHLMAKSGTTRSAQQVLPIDMLRAKLSFFGATHFDPRSDRWVRICMYAGAPYPEELTSENADLWVYPQVPT